jgi:Kef-type K+ transport system membrane component KefB
MAICPSLVEACFIGLIAKPLFDMPYEFTFAMGFIIAAVSPSVVVPGLISLNDRGYGRKNGLVTALIASGTFDDIICIIVFGICKTIGYTNLGMGGNTIGVAIGILIA